MSKQNYTDNIDFDGKWKILIEALFEEFIQFFLPELHTKIDFDQSAKFLKQELPDIAGSSGKQGEMIADNLIQVSFKNGKSQLMLIHIEVHGYENIDFGEKMFRYLCRIYDKHATDSKQSKKITSLAILIADRLPKNYQGFQYQLGRTEIIYNFPVYIIRSQDEATLLKSDNPFALAVLACQHIYQTRQQFPKRMILKSQLFELIWKRYFVGGKFSREVMMAIGGFVNNLMALPPTLNEQYKSKSMSIMVKDAKSIEKLKQETHFQIIDGVFEILFGESMDSFVQRKEQVVTDMELLLKKSQAKMKAKVKRLEAKRQEAEAKREAEEKKRKEAEAKRKEQETILRQQQIDMIMLLHRLNQSAEKISTELKLDLDFVKTVITKNKK